MIPAIHDSNWPIRYDWQNAPQAQSMDMFSARIRRLAQKHKRSITHDRRILMIGSFVQALRRHRGLSYLSLARNASLDPAAIYFLEQGYLRPGEVTERFIERIATGFDLSKNEFLKLSETLTWIRRLNTTVSGAQGVLDQMDKAQ